MDYIVLIQGFMANHSPWLYPMLFLVAWIEGPMLMLFSGFLVSVGVFDWRLVYPVLIFGDLFGDFVWYGIGHYGAKKTIARIGRFFKLDLKMLPNLELKFSHNQKWIIFLSKMTMGFGFAIVTLMAAGMVKMKLRDFGIFNFLGGLVFTAVLMLIGYTMGQAYMIFGQKLELVSTIAGFVVLAFLLAGFGNLMRHFFINKKL